MSLSVTPNPLVPKVVRFWDRSQKCFLTCKSCKRNGGFLSFSLIFTHFHSSHSFHFHFHFHVHFHSFSHFIFTFHFPFLFSFSLHFYFHYFNILTNLHISNCPNPHDLFWTDFFRLVFFSAEMRFFQPMKIWTIWATVILRLHRRSLRWQQEEVESVDWLGRLGGQWLGGQRLGGQWGQQRLRQWRWLLIGQRQLNSGD